MLEKLAGKLAQLKDGLTTKARGDAAEDAALRFLQKHGLKLEARNFIAKGGEIDLIMRDGATLVFVEVRARNHRGYGDAAASVTQLKQQRIAKAAAQYLQQRRGALPACRFDVVGMAEHTAPQWIKSAFDAA
ncbi:MAG: YraN family protein [Burkholderiaceae bacterium]